MALFRSKSSWSTKVLKDEYQNWLVVGHALSLMCDGLRPYNEREAKAFYHLAATNVDEDVYLKTNYPFWFTIWFCPITWISTFLAAEVVDSLRFVDVYTSC